MIAMKSHLFDSYAVSSKWDAEMNASVEFMGVDGAYHTFVTLISGRIWSYGAMVGEYYKMEMYG